MNEANEVDRWEDDGGAVNETPTNTRKPENPLDIQIGGDHYKSLEYQPIEFFEDLHLDAFKANVIKYVARWRKKGGVEDLKKALHYATIARQNDIKRDNERQKMIDRFADQFDDANENEVIRFAVEDMWGIVVADIEHMIIEAEKEAK